MFEKLLIANRGEIACRVIRTAQRLGLHAIAVFSDADADAPHVRLADEALRIGGPVARDSYLNVAAILAAARRSGAQALHPGYGFLSENAAFAQAVLDAGLVFVGPPPSAIAAMGDKALAKQRMREAGVPCAPGYDGDDRRDERLVAEARELGLPLLVKAVAGGGGRGMRLLRGFDELPAALAGARREAQAAFGDDALLLERFIERGRHIEVQVFADAHGACIHLGERDCTAQRRRQKVVEEAPSPVLTPALRERLGADAVAAARAVGYVGAGTVEFIVDEQLRHHFVEMNTRLQVEHPVTEMITGLDLVEWQLRVAAGEPLPLAQRDVRFVGHAIEVRLYAEDAGFRPQTGTVRHWRPDGTVALMSPGLRIDGGIAEGQPITPHYDPLLAKLVAHGRDRADAIRRLRAALARTPLLGVAHNAAFLHGLLGSDDFRSARLHTASLDEWAAEGHAPTRPAEPGPALWTAAAAAFAARHGLGHRPASVAGFDLTLGSGGARRTMRVTVARDALQVALDGEAALLRDVALDPAQHTLTLCHDGLRRRYTALFDGATLHLADGAAVFAFDEPSPWAAAARADDALRLHAPVAGSVAAVAVAVGEAVAEGQPLLCVEAMKMELWLHARRAGRVAALHAAPRDSVAAGALLIELEDRTGD